MRRCPGRFRHHKLLLRIVQGLLGRCGASMDGVLYVGWEWLSGLGYYSRQAISTSSSLLLSYVCVDYWIAASLLPIGNYLVRNGRRDQFYQC